MAAVPKGFKGLAPNDSTPKLTPSNGSGNVSHGRGGAGNMGVSEADFETPNLETPTLKGEVYTTGRGGSG